MTQPPRSTPFSSGSYQAPCGISTTPGMMRGVRRQGRIKRAALVVDFDLIAILDPARCGIDRIDEDALGKGFLQPVVVVMRGMDAMQGVMPDGLQGILASHESASLSCS